MAKLKTFLLHNWLTLVLLIGTLALAGGTVIIALKLKSIGTQPVAPNAPSGSSAQAQFCNSTGGSCLLTFSVPRYTPTPTPPTTITPTPPPACGQLICSTNNDCSGLDYKVCADIGSDNTSQKKCVTNAEWFDGCTPPGPTPTPAPCGVKVCGTDNDCADLDYKVCADIGSDNTSQKKCVTNAEWFDGCTPPGPTQPPTATPTTAIMPEAGSPQTTILFTVGSIILGTAGLLLLL